MDKPTIPQGTRDFGPRQVARRRYILDTIRRTFELFGYAPLETPSLENLSVLTGKYGDEGDQLLFKVLNSGNFLVKERRGEITPLVTPEDLEAGPRAVLPKIAEKGLRYDLTVPFARYVAMNRGTLTFPFRRYQMQPVWRADRPQRGRYREFWQCDADVVGAHSPVCEAEIILMMSQVFEELGLSDYTIKINHRKILTGLYEALRAEGSETDLLVAIDKLDKIGESGVASELHSKGYSVEMTDRLFDIISVAGSFEEKLANLEVKIKNIIGEVVDSPNKEFGRALSNAVGFFRLQEVKKVLQRFQFTQEQFDHLEFDPTLARGLSYYTGCIFEVKINNVPGMGSVSGGGRYDNLTGAFGLPGVSGVGFSFGVDRLYDCLDALNLFPDFGETPTRVLLANFGPDSDAHTLPLLAQLRAAGLPAELYPDQKKLAVQFKYADGKGIPYVLVLGPEEAAADLVKIKTLASGAEQTVRWDEVVGWLRAAVAADK